MTEALRPYLLGAVDDRIRICWEGPHDDDFILSIEASEKNDSRWVYDPKFQNHVGDMDGIYNAEVKGLEPGVAYSYQVNSRSGARSSGSFQLSGGNKGRARYLVMTDPHAFNLKEQMASVATRGRYDAILHLGDMPSGTGVQRDQYQSGWFEAFEGPLAQIPAFYAPGNHDDGPHFDTYFGPQSLSLCRDATGRSFSFTDSTNTHFVFLDSNPWSLSQMNAVNSGVTVPQETELLIEETKNWLTSDLQSDEAQEATWRVVVLHHPYTDEFTNEHIIPIVEAHNVDLVLSGHLHKYHKTVPINSGCVPRPVYITAPSCQDAASGFQRSDGSERLMGDYPEVVAIGDGNYMDLEVSPSALRLIVYGWVDENKLTVVDETVIDKGTGDYRLQMSDLIIDADTEEGCVYLTALVTNDSAGMRVAVVPVIDNGEHYDLHFMSKGSAGGYRYLDSGESVRMTFCHELRSAGDHLVEFGGQQLLVRLPSAAELVCSESAMTLDRDRSLVQVQAELVNQSPSETGRAILQLRWDGVNVVSSPVTLERGVAESRNLVFQYPQGGHHRAELYLNDLLLKRTDFQCGGGIRVIPTLRDKSVWGNDALIRGNPILVADGDRPALLLASDGDYLEIPPSPSMRTPQGFTALVRANVSRLANDDEMAHNPLFVRGKSVGWGATYFARMVIDRNGTMKWGTCHGASEYGWAGGKACVGTWADYLLEFTKDKGGTSAIDNAAVAAVPALPRGASLNEYAELPVFVGYSFIGHVIDEIQRPMYYTHLSAAISEVVFASGERESLGPTHQSSWQADMHPEVRVNLDFGDISVEGGFTSSWRSFRRYQKLYHRDVDVWQVSQLNITADIPAGCQGMITIYTSNDANTVIGSYDVLLHSGADTYPLPVTISGQFVRIGVALTGTVTPGQPIATPTLSKVEVLGRRQDISAAILWSTSAQWADGDFSGNVGVEPVDRLHIFDQFTDPIHG